MIEVIREREISGTPEDLWPLVSDPARGPGFWFVTVNRSRSDGLSGFTGTVLRGRVENEVREGATAGLLMTKKMLEGR